MRARSPEFPHPAGVASWVGRLFRGRRGVVHRAPELLRRACALPVASLYRASEGWVMQRTPFCCGPTTLVNVAHSLGDGTATLETVLSASQPVVQLSMRGMTLDALAVLARFTLRGKVTVLRDLTSAQFCAHLRLFNSTHHRYTINFVRWPLFHCGRTHHSPIGGYLEREDLVLILDVNPLFGPWLVSPARLYEAMNSIDEDCGLRRGMLRIEV